MREDIIGQLTASGAEPAAIDWLVETAGFVDGAIAEASAGGAERLVVVLCSDTECHRMPAPFECYPNGGWDFSDPLVLVNNLPGSYDSPMRHAFMDLLAEMYVEDGYALREFYRKADQGWREKLLGECPQLLESHVGTTALTSWTAHYIEIELDG